MNSMGINLCWCMAQVTTLSVIAMAVYGVVRRFGPAPGAFVSLATLLLMSGMTLCFWSPYPNWMPSLRSQTSSAGIAPDRTSTTAVAPTVEPTREGLEIHEEQVSMPMADLSTWMEGASTFWNDLIGVEPLPVESSNRWHWPGLLAVGLMTVTLLGVLRVVIGLYSVRRYRRTSELITDESLLELVDILAAELGCNRPIELRESRMLAGAATVGWRRPLILLPSSWRNWNEQDRRAVMAHEMAHIYHHDYLSWLIAQIGLAFHFYHPLAHWFCRCLRSDQELIADATAARLAGGRMPYLRSLAQIALVQSDAPVSWAARTFLPTRRTFLRRIEMLRDTKLAVGPAPHTLRWVAGLVLVIATTLAMGLRGPSALGPSIAEAQDPKPQPPTTPKPAAAPSGPAPTKPPTIPSIEPAGPTDQLANVGDPFPLSYIPRDAFVLVAIRPANLLQQAGLEPLAKAIGSSSDWQKDLGVDPQQIRALQICLLPMATRPKGDSMAVIVRMKDNSAAKQLAEHLAPDAVRVEYGTEEYFRREPQDFYFLTADGALVYSKDEGVIRRCLVAGKTGATSAKWSANWNEVSSKQGVAFINTAVVRRFVEPTPGLGAPEGGVPTPSEAFASQFAPIAPFWQMTESVVATLEVSDSLSLRVVARCANANDAQRVQDTLSASAVLMQNILSQARQNAATSRSPDGPLMLGAIDIADELLENMKIEKDDNQATVTATVTATTVDTTRLVSILAPAITSARKSARRTQAINNMKHIALAFHNHVGATGRFPPAVIQGQSRFPRSWRVELLPYLGHADLYNQYRQNEPWDSEHNKQLLAKMPPVYRSPADRPDSTNTSYFVFVGPNTAFQSVQGTQFGQITDGTANTILLVESKRNVPWTKPEDIPLLPGQPLPKLGGWHHDAFIAALCDGSVRMLPEKIDEQTLRLMIMINDGQVIPPIEP